MKCLSATFEVVQLVAGYKPDQGAVVGLITATGEYGGYDETANNGLQVAVGIIERTNGWPTSRGHVAYAQRDRAEVELEFRDKR